MRLQMPASVPRMMGLRFGEPFDERFRQRRSFSHFLRHDHAPPAHVSHVVARTTVISAGDECRKVRRGCVVAQYRLKGSEKCSFPVPAGSVQQKEAFFTDVARQRISDRPFDKVEEVRVRRKDLI